MCFFFFRYGKLSIHKELEIKNRILMNAYKNNLSQNQFKMLKYNTIYCRDSLNHPGFFFQKSGNFYYFPVCSEGTKIQKPYTYKSIKLDIIESSSDINFHILPNGLRLPNVANIYSTEAPFVSLENNHGALHGRFKTKEKYDDTLKFLKENHLNFPIENSEWYLNLEDILKDIAEN
jgi:hypothetical protein